MPPERLSSIQPIGTTVKKERKKERKAWIIPWTEETGGLQSMGLQESDTTE